MNLAVIPARGGSKRIPRKNIKDFCGRPMIAYAIAAAKESGIFDRIIVSTDDDEIAKIARNLGAEIPFLRPPQLANDQAATVPVIAHAIEECKKIGWIADNVCCIYPCVPFIEIGDLRDAYLRLESSDASYCFPVTPYASAIQRALKLVDTGKLEPFFSEFELTRTQDTNEAYHDAGQFYWGKATAWLTNAHIHRDSLGLVIPKWRVVDIDTLEDWSHAEALRAMMDYQSQLR